MHGGDAACMAEMRHAWRRCGRHGGDVACMAEMWHAWRGCGMHGGDVACMVEGVSCTYRADGGGELALIVGQESEPMEGKVHCLRPPSAHGGAQCALDSAVLLRRRRVVGGGGGSVGGGRVVER